MKDIVIYEPNQKVKTPFLLTWIQMWRNIVRSRELIFQLFKRDFLAQYKKSFLGMTWLFVSPLVGIISWVFLNATGVLEPGDVGIPYPAYVLLSSSIWGLFMGFYQASTGTLGAGGGFIMQVNFPHEALLVKQIAQHLANYMITFIMNIAVLLIFGVTPSWWILLFPIITLPLLFLGIAIGLIISVVSVVASDLTNAFNILFGFLFYITPVIYTTDERSDELQTVIELNPLTYLIGGVRDLIIFGKMENILEFLTLTIITFLFLLLSLRLFYVSENEIVEKMI